MTHGRLQVCNDRSLSLSLHLEETRVIVSLSKRDICAEFRDRQSWKVVQLIFTSWRQTLWNEMPELFFIPSPLSFYFLSQAARHFRASIRAQQGISECHSHVSPPSYLQ